MPCRSRGPFGPSWFFERFASRAPEEPDGEGSGTPGRRLLDFSMPASRRPTRRFLSEGLRARRGQGLSCRGHVPWHGPIVVWGGRISDGAASLPNWPSASRARSTRRLRPQAPILPRSKTPPEAPLTDRTPSLYSYMRWIVKNRSGRPACAADGNAGVTCKVRRRAGDRSENRRSRRPRTRRRRARTSSTIRDSRAPPA